MKKLRARREARKQKRRASRAARQQKRADAKTLRFERRQKKRAGRREVRKERIAARRDARLARSQAKTNKWNSKEIIGEARAAAAPGLLGGLVNGASSLLGVDLPGSRSTIDYEDNSFDDFDFVPGEKSLVDNSDNGGMLQNAASSDAFGQMKPGSTTEGISNIQTSIARFIKNGLEGWGIKSPIG